MESTKAKEILKGNNSKKPSEQNIHYQYFRDGINSVIAAQNIPNITISDALENAFKLYPDVPAFKWLKTYISRPEAIAEIYDWARIFRSTDIGVMPGEIVIYYGPSSARVAMMALGLIMIGGCMHFVKLGIDNITFDDVTEGTRFAIVFDGFYSHIKTSLNDDRFKRIFVHTPSDSLSFPLSKLVKYKSYKDNKKANNLIPKDNKKFIWTDESLKIAKYNTGNPKIESDVNRMIYLTYSSGTSGKGLKPVPTTNKQALAQIEQHKGVEMGLAPGKVALNNLPFVASTSVNSLLNIPLYFGMTVSFDPRVSADGFYNQVLNEKPQFTVTTGPVHMRLIDKVDKMTEKPDLSFWTVPIIGGQGINPYDLEKSNRVLAECGAGKTNLGCGLSEVFSTAQSNLLNLDFVPNEKKHLYVSVGINYPGTHTAIFNEDGNEVAYGEWGELKFFLDKTLTATSGYYKRDDLTNNQFDNEKMLFATGDRYMQDEYGKLYCGGRINDCIFSDSASLYFPFEDINSYAITDESYLVNFCNNNLDAYEKAVPDNAIRYFFAEKRNINDASVVVGHVVFHENFNGNSNHELTRLKIKLQKFFPDDIVPKFYSIHESFAIDPTTLKTHRKQINQKLDSFIFINEEGYKDVSLKQNINDDTDEVRFYTTETV